MARTRTYDVEAVRTGLMQVFHEKGFANASLIDLEQGSGLNRRQLYNDFGDKKAVFLGALDDFAVIAGNLILAPLERGEAGIEDIRSTLFSMIALAKTGQGRLGCMVCNTSGEVIAEDPDVADFIARYFRRIERAYRRAIARAVACNEILPSENPRPLARFFFGVHVSLCVLGRAGEPVASMRDIANEAMKRFD